MASSRAVKPTRPREGRVPDSTWARTRAAGEYRSDPARGTRTAPSRSGGTTASSRGRRSPATSTATATRTRTRYFFYLVNRPVLVLKCDQGFDSKVRGDKVSPGGRHKQAPGRKHGALGENKAGGDENDGATLKASCYEFSSGKSKSPAETSPAETREDTTWGGAGWKPARKQAAMSKQGESSRPNLSHFTVSIGHVYHPNSSHFTVPIEVILLYQLTPSYCTNIPYLVN